jgi:hypothetical protein
MSPVEIHTNFNASGLRVVPTVAKLPKSDNAKKLQYIFIVRLFSVSMILPEIS